ncbi:MAG: [protein-PII] uridylyltransferase [Nitrospirota bacterium]
MRSTALKEYREAKFLDIKARSQQETIAGNLGSGIGNPRQVLSALTALADEIVEALYQEQLEAATSSNRSQISEGLAVIALAGYGRSELSPFSDLDLMFLYKASCQTAIEAAAKVILHRLWDIGFSVGHSVRTVKDCLTLSKSDIVVRTSLLEPRCVTGNQALFEQLSSQFCHSISLRRTASFYIASKIKERKKECNKYGTTVYLLEPNIKCSQGGLRDIHLMRWLSACRYQTGSLLGLKALNILSQSEYQTLLDAQDFVLQVRNDLHFGANQSQDVLTFDDQIRLASRYQFQDQGDRLAVEQFMTKYYEKTAQIRDITRPVIEQMMPKPFGFFLKRFFQRRMVEGNFQWVGGEISILPDREEVVLSDLSKLLKLFHLTQIHHLKLSSETVTLIKAETEKPYDQKPDIALFLQILGRVGQVGSVLRELHRLKLLERIIPAFGKARALMQFNAYHKYTVDEHCFRAVEAAEGLIEAPSYEGQVYREIHQKDILHLALLLHDIGKGEEGDHSEAGVYVAGLACEKLGIPERERDLLLFLVREHLLMTHLAFRRDLSDSATIIQFANKVGTVQTLKMLYILTFSDVAAVGEGTLTDWKRDLLRELFERTFVMLAGEDIGATDGEMRIIKMKEAILLDSRLVDKKWVQVQLPFISARSFLSVSYEKMVEHLEAVYALSNEKVRVTANYDEAHKITEYTIYTLETGTEAIFSKISGVMAAKGLQILGATIMTWENRVVVDTFLVEDPDYAGRPDSERLCDVSGAISNVILGNLRVEALLIHGRRRRGPITIRRIPTRVAIDNFSSESFTILEVFADDCQGLLYFIAKAIFEIKLSVHTAKISTHMDQIVDVFYVTDLNGKKMSDPSQIADIRAHLIQTIDRFLEYSRTQG